MFKYRYSIVFTPDEKFTGINEDLKVKIVEAVNTVDLLYGIQTVNADSGINLENYFYSLLKDKISAISCFLNKEGRCILNGRLALLSKGEFDIIDIPFITGEGEAELLFGKIISPERQFRKLYAAAAGVPSDLYNTEVSKYDESFFSDYSGEQFFREAIGNQQSLPSTDFSCMDVMCLGGEMNRKNKPVSVFYSGDKTSQRSAQSKVTLFTNLYFTRFDLISARIGSKYIEGFKEVLSLESETRNTILLYWLRGHDLCHSVGADNLGRNMTEERFKYYSLHELKSDILSLYYLIRFRSSLKSLSGVGESSILYIFVSEALRYARRGNPGIIPDTTSALMALSYLERCSVLNYSRDGEKMYLDKDRIIENLEGLCLELLELFRKGDASDALRFCRHYSDPGYGLISDIIKDSDIPYYIDLQQN